MKIHLSWGALAGALLSCLLPAAPPCASAQAAPVPASAAYTLTDAAGNVLTAPPAAPQTVTVTLTLTNAQASSSDAVAPLGSDRLQTPGTNADGSTGSKTSVVTFPARAAVSHDLQNVTDTLTLPTVRDKATGNLVPILAPVLPLPAGWTQLSPTVLQYTQALLPGGAAVRSAFQSTMVGY